MEPLNKDTLNLGPAILSFVERGCPLSEVIFYRVCIQEYFRLVLCWEVCPLSECPLSEVSQYVFASNILLYMPKLIT